MLQGRASMWVSEQPPENYAKLEGNFDDMNARMQTQALKIVRMSRSVLRFLENPEDIVTMQPLEIFWKSLNRRVKVIDELYKAKRLVALSVWDHRTREHMFDDHHFHSITSFSKEMDELQTTILRKVDELDKLLDSGRLSSVRNHVLEAAVGVGNDTSAIDSLCICKTLASQQKNFTCEQDEQGKEELKLRRSSNVNSSKTERAPVAEGPLEDSEDDTSELEFNPYNEDDVNFEYEETFAKAEKKYFDAPLKEKGSQERALQTMVRKMELLRRRCISLKDQGKDVREIEDRLQRMQNIFWEECHGIDRYFERENE